jgi:hypothetical protein
MHAIQIAVTHGVIRAMTIVYHAPAWPNLPAAAGLPG